MDSNVSRRWSISWAQCLVKLKPKSLETFESKRNWNDQDGLSGRKVWWNYWDTCIRSDLDYNNQLRYIFWNPVKHGLVENPEDYRFSNYKEFLQGEPDFIFTNMDEVNDVPEF